MSAIGQLLDRRYRITQILAAGGFGQTFLAEDTRRPGSPLCVVKQLRRSNNQKGFQIARRLFDKEAEMLEKLGQHDQIPRLLAHFEENQEFFLVEEYIPGHPLIQELVPGKCKSEAEVIDLLRQILEILAFVHSNNVIHRDIKPANLIRRQPDNKIVLIDFGAVKELSTQITQSGSNPTVAIGTRPYMPIEQFQGEPQYNSDVYALGVIGVQAVTGLSADELSRPHILSKPPVNNNRSKNGWRNHTKVSSVLANLIDKMLHYDFRQRYQSAREVLADLSKIKRSSIATRSKSLLPLARTSIKQHRRHWLIRWSIRLGVGVLVLAALTTVLFLALAPREAILLLSGAGKYMFFQDYQGAISDFNNAIRINPKYAHSYTLRGIVRFNLGDYPGSIADYTKVLQLQPNNALIYNNRGIVRSLNREHKQAIADFNQALKVNPNYAEVYINRGQAYINLKDYQAALKDFDQAIQMQPDLVQAYTSRGLARSRLGNQTLALQDYSQALRLKPNNVTALNNRGLLRTKQGDYQGAIDDFEQALKVSPENGQFYYGKAEAYEKLGNQDSAISDYQKAAKFCLDDGLTGCYQDSNYRLKQMQPTKKLR